MYLLLSNESADRSIRGGGEICDTIICTFNGEIIEQVKQFGDVYEGGYLTNLNGRFPWYIYEERMDKVAVAIATVEPMVVGNRRDKQEDLRTLLCWVASSRSVYSGR